MQGYGDITFCSAKCSNKACYRNITQDVRREGERWWGSQDFPIAVADFSKDCGDYQPQEYYTPGQDPQV